MRRNLDGGGETSDGRLHDTQCLQPSDPTWLGAARGVRVAKAVAAPSWPDRQCWRPAVGVLRWITLRCSIVTPSGDGPGPRLDVGLSVTRQTILKIYPPVVERQPVPDARPGLRALAVPAVRHPLNALKRSQRRWSRLYALSPPSSSKVMSAISGNPVRAADHPDEGAK